MSGSRKDRTAVILENFQPSRGIGSILFPRLLLQFEISTQESRPQLGNELFAAVTFIAPTLAAKVAVKALSVFRPVSQFMGESGVVALGIAEGEAGELLFRP